MNPQTSLHPDPSQGSSKRPPPKLPCPDLINGSREEYLKICVPLYKASIRCDWKAAKVILDERPELVRYSITENRETALHIAASAKGSLKMDDFVHNLVNKMETDDLELQNTLYNTAFYSAVAAGNITTVKLMMAKNNVLLAIPGAGGDMMPLYAAVFFGNYEVVKYLYEKSNLHDDGWTDEYRGWLLEKCIEADMFDVALQIVEEHPELASKGNALAVLARKTDALSLRKYNFLRRIVIWVFVFVGLMKGASERETKALPLLRTIWKEIAKKPKPEVDNILRGPPDQIKQDSKSAIGWSAQSTRLQVLISKYVTRMKVENPEIFRTGPSDSTNQHMSVVINQSVKLQNLISGHLADMHDETQIIIRGSQDSINKDNKTPSGMEYQALELQKLISKHIVDMHNETINIIKKIQNEDQLPLKLQELILKYIENLSIETEKIIQRHSKETYSSRVLFIAAELGNTNFLIELIGIYPDLIWKVNDNNQSIFHIAVKHRHEGIYNLLYEIGAMKDMITPLKDNHANNMLHLVGKRAKQKWRLQSVVVLQMQQELLWFQEVEAMIPPSYREQKNEDDLTPHELFTKEHKELVTLCEKWMKGTASQCIVVATLIATIVFAGAFMVPGGYNQNTGIPFFRSKTTFMVFVVANAISLFSSTTSILMFLSILMSRYTERDFLISLPRKLGIGLWTLFYSIATMTLAFSVSFFVFYNKGLLWTPILISAFGVMPVLLYVSLHHGLYINLLRGAYHSRYLFKPKKHVLYYENPKV